MDALNKPGESRPRVLIVDDEAGICLLLNELLNDAGYQCQTASSGEQALEILRQQEFAALISDLRMPGMSGLALLEAARAQHPNLTSTLGGTKCFVYAKLRFHSVTMGRVRARS